MRIIDRFKSDKRWIFVGGIIAGLILTPLAKSKTVHKAAVNVTAKGMELKDCAMNTYECIKEDAQDVYAEAKKKAAEGDGPAQ